VDRPAPQHGREQLAWLAIGGNIDQVCTTPPVLATYQPDPDSHAALMSRHARFRALYPLLAPSFNSGA
jgi:xylulokinase